MKKTALTIVLVLALLVSLAGCGQAQSGEPGRMVNITASVDPAAEEMGLQFTTAALTGNIHDNIEYSPGISQVEIELDGKKLALEEAIEKGEVTMNQLLFAAKEDAARGFCQVREDSWHGLNQFIFTYPEYDLTLVDDVFEPPMGENRHVQYLALRRSGEAKFPAEMLFDATTHDPIDMEDWGLTFAVKDVTAQGMTLVCTQAGGQQLTELRLAFGYICKADADRTQVYAFTDHSMSPLTMEGETTFPLTWPEELPAGEYILQVSAWDHYDPESLHPLMTKYNSGQGYGIPFQVS